LRLNNYGNVIVSAVIFPAIAALFAFSNEIIPFLFTQEYVSVAPVLRIYLVQTLISIEVTTFMFAFNQGSVVMRYEGAILPFAVVSSLVGVRYYGVPGAAMGSVLSTVIVYALFLTRLSRVMNVPIAKLQDWKGLAKILSVSALCALTVRVSADTLKPSTTIAAIGGPAAVLGLYAIVMFATGHHRTLVVVQRE
jgi:O-antigen/teichoic acid export membrane protein